MQKKLAFLEKIEEYLLKSNIHIDIVKDIMNLLLKSTISNNYSNNEIIELLRHQISYMINKYNKDFNINIPRKPYVMMVCGINGTGKTTTIGKMANLLMSYGWDLLIASCDTFRAAADEQLNDLINNNSEIFITKENDNDTPAKIAIRAYNIAKQKNKDILIIDTSGRIHNNKDLMAELLKLKQKLKKNNIDIPHDTVLIIDSNCGYNALEQAKMYNDLIGIDGIIATKIDIAKRPGVILSICKKLNLSIYGVCSGENKDNISSLDSDAFADAILCDINEII